MDRSTPLCSTPKGNRIDVGLMLELSSISSANEITAGSSSSFFTAASFDTTILPCHSTMQNKTSPKSYKSCESPKVEQTLTELAQNVSRNVDCRPRRVKIDPAPENEFVIQNHNDPDPSIQNQMDMAEFSEQIRQLQIQGI